MWVCMCADLDALYLHADVLRNGRARAKKHSEHQRHLSGGGAVGDYYYDSGWEGMMKF